MHNTMTSSNRKSIAANFLKTKMLSRQKLKLINVTRVMVLDSYFKIISIA